MEYAIIVLSSVTYARRVQTECEREGIACTIGHTPKQIARRGCSFMVKVNIKNLNKALSVVDKLMLKTYGIYKKTGEDSYDLLG